MSFSGAVKLADLNDYINLAQNCVKPISVAPTEKKMKIKSMIELELDSTDLNVSVSVPTLSSFGQIKVSTEKKTAKITLADCLACNGCITSAETILIQQQSLEEFELKLHTIKSNYENKITLKKHLVVMTVSTQSRTALAAKYGLSLLQVAKKLTTFLKGLGVDYVIDASIGTDIALIEAREEFVAKFVENVEKPPFLLSGECPGWVCYSEKTHPELLPFISKVRSPQQIIGVLAKTYFAQLHGFAANEVCHIAIMPCFDKKLEASRPDFYSESLDVNDVDCVLSTLEFEELIQAKCESFAKLEESRLDSFFSNVSEDQQVLLSSLDYGASGGYSENIYRYACKRLFNVDIPLNQPLQYKSGRNSDFKELIFQLNEKTLLSFAVTYGFRNIQNITRLVKNDNLKYHYVEVMACPSGCLNGGGQIKVEPSQNKEHLKKMQELHHDLLVC